MLQTLKSYSNQEAAVILAGVTRQLLPEELIEPTDDPIPVDAEMRQRVLGEVYGKLRLSKEDKSEESQARVIDYIGSELSRSALAGSDLQEIENRVGQQGNLRPDIYKVILTSQAERVSRKYGISRLQIKTSINNADNFQHLLPGALGPVNDVSLFIKCYPDDDDPFTIIVQTQRVGATLKVQHAFKIYHSDVNVDDTFEPLNFLLAFIERYGLVITVGDETGKFVMYKSVPRDPDQQSVDFLTVHADKGISFRSGVHFKLTQNTFEVAVGYAINETKYLADPKKHEQLGRK